MYDSLDRVEKVQYNIGTNGAFITVYTYQYDSAGRLFSVTDHQNNEQIRYVYDFGGNLLKSYTADTATDQIKSSETFRYDEQSRLSIVKQEADYAYSGGVGDAWVNYTYFYNDTTGNLRSLAVVSMGFEAWMYYTFDDFGRTTQKTVSGTNFYNTYNYDYKTYNTLQESALVSQLISQTYAGEDGEPIWGTVYNYSYDQNGNITEIRDVLDVIQYRYQYDELGQLTREDNRPLNKSYTWTYDDAGNIQSKSTYAFTTGTLGAATSTVNYGYDDATWGDLLTYDGYFTIRYDEVGNPKHLLEYEEDDFLVGARLVWQGRQLMGYHLGQGYSGEIDEYYSSITFTYNADGIRIGKNVNGTQYEYIVSGSQILAEKWTSGGVEHFLQYMYDESGAPIGLNYRTNEYAEDVFDVFYFEKNLQGDIVAIYNDSGTKIGTYAYDAWGNFTYSTTSGITALERSIVHSYNPFRYRGYYYDDDLGMYYLQSRYYNPQWGRFLNADGYVSTGTGFLGYNMFAYCNNNPVMYVDLSGESFFGFILLTTLYIAPIVIVVGTIAGDVLEDIDDISISGELYNSDRGKSRQVQEDSFVEKSMWYDITGGSMENDSANFISAEVGLDKGTYSWDYFEMEAGLGKISGGVSTSIIEGVGLSASAESVYGTAFFKIPIGNHQLSIGGSVNAGSIGATAKFGAETQIGVACGIGGSLFIKWD